MIINRGDILLVDLGSPVGSEQGGKRPFVVMSNNTGNKKGKTITGIPITKQEKPNMPTHVAVPEGLLTETSVVLAEQIRTVSITRIMRKMTRVDASFMAKIENALMIQLGLTKNVNYDYLFNLIDGIIKLKPITKREPTLNSTLCFLANSFRDYCKQYNLDIKVVQTNYKINRSLKGVKV